MEKATSTGGLAICAVHQAEGDALLALSNR
jgi:hypothetical protein